MITLARSGISIAVDPARGGGITRFERGGCDIFQPVRSDDGSALGLACFALVPYANRIGGGTFEWQGETVRLPVNCPAASDSHPLHGDGWLNRWSLEQVSQEAATLSYRHDEDAWPWAYTARQTIALREDGYTHALSVTNLSGRAMPAGLGLHPYFPKSGAALQACVSHVWPAGPDELPGPRESCDGEIELLPQDQAYLRGGTTFRIDWPTHSLSIDADPAFEILHVFVPAHEPFFCVEPVSHPPNHVIGMRVLPPQECWSTSTRFRVSGQP